jgi:hypothetical protein
MKLHPIANLFPTIEANTREFRDLVGSIEEDGLIDPIVLHGDVLVDGRNRLAACKEAGVEPKFVQWETLKPKSTLDDWIYSRNINRRHLTPDQVVSIYTQYNALIIKKANEGKKRRGLKIGRKMQKGSGDEIVSTEDNKDLRSTVGQIAKASGVSYHKARQALKLRAAVEQGRIDKNVEIKVSHGLVKLKDALPSRSRGALRLSHRIAAAWKSFKAKFSDSELPIALQYVQAEIKK